MDFTDRIDDIVNVLLKDGVILYPTDTIWGLGCDCRSEKAIKRIFKIKKRDITKPLLILVNSIDMIKSIVTDMHPRIETLLQFHKKPLTIIYPQANKINSLLQHSNGSVAIRIVQDDFCISLINKLGGPIVSTSANISTQKYPENFSKISKSIINKADYIVKHKQELKDMGEPSVLIKYNAKGDLIFLRE